MAKTATAATTTSIKGKSVKPKSDTNGAPPARGGSMSFKPVDFDAKEIPPDAPEGEWIAKAAVKKSTSKEGFARLIIEWKLEETDNEEHEHFLGSNVSDLITFYPDDDIRRSKMSKLQLRDLCEVLEIDPDVIPTKLRTWADLKELIEAIDGQKLTIYTIVRKTDDGERTNVKYKARGGESTKLSTDDEEGEEGEEGEEEGAEEEAEEGEEEETEEEEEAEEEEEEPAPKTKLKKAKK